MKVDFYSTTSMPESLKNDYTRIFRHALDNDSLIDGASCRNFEDAFAQYLAVPYLLGVGNGFDALKIGLQALGVTSGDRVAVPAHTFIATWYAILAIGALPVGVDVTPNGQIDLDNLEQLQELKAVIPVHMHGTHCDMARLTNWAAAHKILVLEDCAQAAGLEIQGKKAGSWGDAAAFSFYPTKNLFALGDGGAIAFKDPTAYELARSLSRYGTANGNKYVHTRLGQNSRLDTIQAAFLTHSLPILNEWNYARMQIAKSYSEHFHSLLFDSSSTGNHIFHHFVVKLNNRNSGRLSLKEGGVATEVHYPIPAGIEAGGEKSSGFETTWMLSNHGLSLPISPWQTIAETNYVREILEILINTSREN